MRPDVVLTVAHSPVAKGAVSACGKIVEHDYSIKICEAALNYLTLKGVNAVLAPVGVRSFKINYVNKQNPRCCVEPHLNSNVISSPSGVMTLFAAGSKDGEALAADTCAAMASGLKQFKNWGPWSVPGKMARHDRLPYLDNTVCPAVITESLFVSNPKDVEWLLSDNAPETLGMLISEGIIAWLKR